MAVNGTRVSLEVNVPSGRILTHELLPALHAVTNSFVAAEEARVPLREEKISCKKGCGACCRQVVPIAPAEARFLVALVQGFDIDRQRKIRDRFTAIERQLSDAGLFSRLLRGETGNTEEREQLGLDYFRLGLPCPFLEDESCSIHENRPLVCREYLVTSPADRCKTPNPQEIRTVPMPVRVSSALYQFSDEEDVQKWMPLSLAFAWNAVHEGEGNEYPGIRLFERIVSQALATPD